MTPSIRSSPLGIAIAVAALHSLNDAYTAFLPPLLPRIMGELDLSITLAAGLNRTAGEIRKAARK